MSFFFAAPSLRGVTPCTVGMPTHRPLSTKRLDISNTARADIREVIVYLAEIAGAEVAGKFLLRIDAELTKLAHLGHSGVSREWISPGLRLHVLGDYCVYFRVTETETRIVRFLRGSRDLNPVLFEGEGEQ